MSQLTSLVNSSYNAQKLANRGVSLPNDKEWLTVDDVYEELGKTVPLDTIRSWIRSKRLPAYRPGKAYLIRREDLEKFLENSRTTPDNEPQ